MIENMRKLLFTIIIFPIAAFAANTYRWTDEQGVVHYSDKPHPGAEIIHLREAQGYSPPPLERPSALSRSREEGTTQAADTDSGGYESLSFTSPTAEEVLWNLGGTLNVNMSLRPRLQRGHSIELYFDGTLVSPPRARRLSFQVNDVNRGEHSLRAQIVDASGNTLTGSDTIRFYVQQTAIRQGPSPSNLPSRPRG
jgi:hypothetical protein